MANEKLVSIRQECADKGTDVLMIKLDGWITCHFTSFSTVFQSYMYLGNTWAIMEG